MRTHWWRWTYRSARLLGFLSIFDVTGTRMTRAALIPEYAGLLEDRLSARWSRTVVEDLRRVPVAQLAWLLHDVRPDALQMPASTPPAGEDDTVHLRAHDVVFPPPDVDVHGPSTAKPAGASDDDDSAGGIGVPV